MAACTISAALVAPARQAFGSKPTGARPAHGFASNKTAVKVRAFQVWTPVNNK